MEIILLILQVLILVALWVLVLIYKNSLPAYLSEKGKNLATKQDIAEITREIESVKSAFFEYQTQFSLFHQKRFEAISGTYELLHDATEFVMHMVHPLQYGGDEEEAQRQKQAIEAFNKLSGFYWKHKIYLPENICEKIEVVSYPFICSKRLGLPFVRSYQMMAPGMVGGQLCLQPQDVELPPVEFPFDSRCPMVLQPVIPSEIIELLAAQNGTEEARQLMATASGR